MSRAAHQKIKRGEIYWVEPDTSKGAIAGISHPHVVVQDDIFNRSRISTVVVCALSTNLKRASEPSVVLLEMGEANLEKQSVVIASQISCIYKTRLGERIGQLSPQRVEQILNALQFLQTSFFRE